MRRVKHEKGKGKGKWYMILSAQGTATHGMDLVQKRREEVKRKRIERDESARML
jgi:hypothetical protein